MQNAIGVYQTELASGCNVIEQIATLKINVSTAVQKAVESGPPQAPI
jgi:hypothetical protein